MSSSGEHGSVVVTDPAPQDFFVHDGEPLAIQRSVFVRRADVLAVLDIVDEVADEVELGNGGDILDRKQAPAWRQEATALAQNPANGVVREVVQQTEYEDLVEALVRQVELLGVGD